MPLQLYQLFAGIALVLGLILALYGLAALFAREYLQRWRNPPSDPVLQTGQPTREPAMPPTPLTTVPPLKANEPSVTRAGLNQLKSDRVQSSQGTYRTWVALGLLVAIALLGSLLRLDGLDNKTIGHPEVYVPGIELPEGISEPPPRLTLYRVLWWHFHDEPHPQGYYLFMWVWTKLFGTSVYSLRLPSVLFGVGSIILIFWIASLAYGHTLGLLSAGLLAFNGFHIFWSQHARMYAMGCFLGLLSTLLLLQLARDTNTRPLREGFYVVVSSLGVLTQIFFWPFLGTQILWVIVHRSASAKILPRIVFFQALIIILSSPLWAHAVYRGRHPSVASPSLSFLQEYVSFGFLFQPDFFSVPPRGMPVVAVLLVLLLAAVCLGRGLVDAGYRFALPSTTGSPAVKRLFPVAVGSVMIILAMAILAHRRQQAMVLAGFVSILSLFMPSVLKHVRSSVQPGLRRLEERLPFLRGLLSPFFLPAFVPILIIFGISFWKPLLASRAFLLFIPYLLVVIALGIRGLSRTPLLGVPLGILLVILHISSIAHFRHHPMDARDYQDLTQKVATKIEADDLIFVHRKDWATTPIFYYLESKKYHFIAEGFQNAALSHPDSRIWVILFGEQQPTQEMNEALANFHLQDQVEALRAKAMLYVRNHLSTTKG